LKAYVDKSENKDIKKWWAQYCESQGDYDAAIDYYEKAGDVLQCIRILCMSGNYEEAIEMALKTPDHAARFYLAQQYEMQGNAKEAIRWYVNAKCFNKAIVLAKENKLPEELMQLTLTGKKKIIMEIAKLICIFNLDILKK
jgi:intraflagellar transport protein 140